MRIPKDLCIVAGGVLPDYNPGTARTLEETIAMRRSLVFGWIVLCGAAAMAEPPVKVASIEGVTEYRLRQRGAGAVLPRGVAADRDREHDRARRQPPRRLRRIRHGPPARAHGLQGHARPPAGPQGAPRSRGQLQRHHQQRPHQLLRDHARHRREPRVRHRHGMRPARQQLRQGRGPAVGDDRRPQRVRTRREQPGLDPQPADLRRGLRMAQLRQVHDRQPHRHRTRAHREPPGLLQEILSAG